MFMLDYAPVRMHSWISKEVVKLTQNLKAKTLEYLSVAICNWLLSSCNNSVWKVKVQIDKPAAIKEAEHATVVSTRRRESSLQEAASSSVQPSSFTSRTRLDAPQVPENPNIFNICGLDFCGLPQLPLPSKSTMASQSLENLCYIAIGTNIGQRQKHIHDAIARIRKFTNVRHVSSLYESPAAYVTNQPSFLNCVISVETTLGGLEILKALKEIETELGRIQTFRYGPRVIDLDVVLMGSQIIEEPSLSVPHALMHERAFVLKPLLDILTATFKHPKLHKTLKELYQQLPLQDVQATRQVIPVPAHSADGQERLIHVDSAATPRLFGVINVTPDSFSDGGKHLSAANTLASIQAIWRKDPSVIVDIGGESTAPSAPSVSESEEWDRVEPVLKAINEAFPSEDELKRPIVSIDTTKLGIATKAFSLNCDILNDVYAAPRFYSDRKAHEEMARLVADSGKPWVMMHCRGSSSNMKSLANYEPGTVASSVATELLAVIKSALELGVLPWQIIVDPGIGFAKTAEQNVEILKDVPRFRLLTGGLPTFVGASRKRFLGMITQQEEAPPAQRDAASNALLIPLVQAGVKFFRVHDVSSAVDTLHTYEYVWRQQ